MSGWFRAMRSDVLSALLAGVSLRESPPGAARQRVTFLAGTRKVTKRSALKCKRTFDRASEPLAATAPLEFRLEMRSVCAVALSTTATPRYGSASRTAQQSDERFAPMQSKRCLPFDCGRGATDAVSVRCALRSTEAPRYRSGGRTRYQKASSACRAPARSVYVRLLGGTAGAPVPRSCGGTERYSAH